MSAHLMKHIGKFVEITDNEFATVIPFFQSLKPLKKQNLVSAGQVCKSNYFVVKGCLRMFFINSKGVEQTIQFAIENWWISDYSSFESRARSAYTIQAVEASEVLAIDYESQEKMLELHPKLERYFRLINQKAHSASQSRIKFLYGFSREELYRHFCDNYPDFVQRIPQYLLASYLGFTPEYLSEIRRKR